MTYDVGISGPGLEQTYNCASAKSVHEIVAIYNLLNELFPFMIMVLPGILSYIS